MSLNDAGAAILSVDDELDFCTFYNCLSLKKWQDLTDLNSLGLHLSGSGEADVTLLCYGKDAMAAKLASRTVDLAKDGVWWVDLQQAKDAAALAITLKAKTQCTLSSGAWVTATKPRREVKIAGVITTFNREHMATAAIKNFAESVIPKADGGFEHLFVIDNGQNLGAIDAKGVTVLPNKNLGGSGGFTRGLMHVQDQGNYTHVLFMDDDAACEPEAVWRTAALLRYVKDEKTSVSGGMLLSENPGIQYEKSANIALKGKRHSAFQPISAFENIIRRENVVFNDLRPDGNYGAWWFYCFPVAAIESLPFPFFVRGDDQDFALANKLPVVTLNGITTYGEDLRKRVSPAVNYLSVRSLTSLVFLYGDQARAQATLRQQIRSAINFGRVFDYGNMEAVLEALEDAAKGPVMYGEMPSPLPKMKELGKNASGRSLELDDIPRLTPNWKRSRGMRGVWDRITLFGSRRATEQYSDRIAVAIDVEAVKKMYTRPFKYIASGSGPKAKVYERDNERFIRNYLRAQRLKRDLKAAVPSIMENYRSEHEQYRTREYWSKALELE